jgi:hypothetical protein
MQSPEPKIAEATNAAPPPVPGQPNIATLPLRTLANNSHLHLRAGCAPVKRQKYRVVPATADSGRHLTSAHVLGHQVWDARRNCRFGHTWKTAFGGGDLPENGIARASELAKEIAMIKKLSVAAGLWIAVALSTSMAASPTSAPQSLLPNTAEFDGALVHQTQEGYRNEKYQYGRFGGYYSRCHYRRRECARRWGWGTWRYRRCVHSQLCRAR